MVTYEWVIETVTMDEYEDIVSVDHADTFAAASKKAAFACEDGCRVRLGLVRDRWDDYDGDLEDRQWAYLEDGKLPERFTRASGPDDGGAAVPKRYSSTRR